MKVIHVYGEDWEGIYLGDNLLNEGHSIRISPLLSSLIGCEITSLESYEIDQDYLEGLGSLPEKFSYLDKENLFQ